MGQHRKNISIPTDAIGLLEALATDCGMDASQCITQLLRRHHNDIRTLFSINVCSHTHDSRAIVETGSQMSQSVPTIAKLDPIVTMERSEVATSTDIYSKPVETTANEAPANAFFDMDFEA